MRSLKVLNDIKLMLDDQGNHFDSFRISLKCFGSFRGPLFHKPVTGQELFVANWCKKNGSSKQDMLLSDSVCIEVLLFRTLSF